VSYLRDTLFPPQLQSSNDCNIWEGGKQKWQLGRWEIRPTEKIMPEQTFLHAILIKSCSLFCKVFDMYV